MAHQNALAKKECKEEKKTLATDWLYDYSSKYSLFDVIKS